MVRWTSVMGWYDLTYNLMVRWTSVMIVSLMLSPGAPRGSSCEKNSSRTPGNCKPVPCISRPSAEEN